MTTTQTNEVNRGYLDHIRGWSQTRAASRRVAGTATRTFLRLLAMPIALLWGVAIVLLLPVVRRKRGAESPTHDRALDCIDLFVRQYPMHLYPIVAKSLELAYLSDVLRRMPPGKDIAEVAIGEGTLSAKLFLEPGRVIGVDLNPYSLRKAVVLPHVHTGIVGDGLNPPLTHGGYDLLISNNFLHHVTEKASTIRNWSAVASRVLFNDNTPYWSRSFARPYVLRAFGLRNAAENAAKDIELELMQHLESQDAVIRYARESCDIVEQQSFLSSKAFFLCATFSALIGSYGPPTPRLMKLLYNRILSPLAIPLTRAIAKAIVRFDATQDRSTDTYLTLLCESRLFKRASSDAKLRCPACGGNLSGQTCTACGATYERKDGMLFLLPSELAQVAMQYRPEVAASIPSEHL